MRPAGQATRAGGHYRTPRDSAESAEARPQHHGDHRHLDGPPYPRALRELRAAGPGISRSDRMQHRHRAGGGLSAQGRAARHDVLRGIPARAAHTRRRGDRRAFQLRTAQGDRKDGAPFGAHQVRRPAVPPRCARYLGSGVTLMRGCA